VDVMPDGRVLVLDLNTGISFVDPETGVVTRGQFKTPFYNPRGVGVGADGSIAVADTGGGRIVIISPNGDETVLGGYNQPTDAAFLSPDRLVVAEPGFQRAIEIDKSGHMQAEWGQIGRAHV